MKIIDGKILDTIIKGGTLKTIDGIIYDGLGIDETTSLTSLSAIAFVKYYNGSVTATLPIYNVSDITNNQLRIINKFL